MLACLLHLVCSCVQSFVPQSALVGFVDMLISLIEEACKNWVRFKQYFAIFADVVDFGDAERCVEMTLFSLFYLALTPLASQKCRMSGWRFRACMDWRKRDGVLLAWCVECAASCWLAAVW
jgi:hypothetical protein